MDITLVVVRPFGPHAVGDRVTSSDDIAAILGSEHATFIVQVPTPTNRPEG